MSGIALFNYNSGRAEGSRLLSDAVEALSKGASEEELLKSGKYPEDIVKKASRLALMLR